MGALMIWDGTAWQIVSQQGPSGGNAMWVGPSAPPGTPVTGDEWFDTDEPNVGLTLPLSVANGGTGAASAPAARTTLQMPGEELAYNQITTPVTITTTNNAAQQTIVAGTTRTYDGNPIMIEFYSPRVDAPTNTQTLIHLCDGATNLGYFVLVLDAAGTSGVVASARRRITPTAGSHNYNITGWAGAATGGYVGAGPGAALGDFSPAFIRVTRA